MKNLSKHLPESYEYTNCFVTGIMGQWWKMPDKSWYNSCMHAPILWGNNLPVSNTKSFENQELWKCLTQFIIWTSLFMGVFSRCTCRELACLLCITLRWAQTRSTPHTPQSMTYPVTHDLITIFQFDGPSRFVWEASLRKRKCHFLINVWWLRPYIYHRCSDSS